MARRPPPEVQSRTAKQNISEMRRRFWPNKVVASRTKVGDCRPLDPLFEGKALQDAAIYVCEHYACQEPAVGEAEMRAALDRYAPR